MTIPFSMAIDIFFPGFGLPGVSPKGNISTFALPGYISSVPTVPAAILYVVGM